MPGDTSERWLAAGACSAQGRDGKRTEG